MRGDAGVGLLDFRVDVASSVLVTGIGVCVAGRAHLVSSIRVDGPWFNTPSLANWRSML